MSRWQQLRALGKQAGATTIKGLFEQDENRARRFSASAGSLLLDYSKTLINPQTRGRLLELIEESGLALRRAEMFSGRRINVTENRAVLHVALRSADAVGNPDTCEDVAGRVARSLRRMETFSSAVRAGLIRPLHSARFTDVLNIGIGGSHLGPAMAVAALQPYCDGLRLHAVSNIDGADVTEATAGLDPKSTLVIVASKTMTTAETMANARTVRDWMTCELGKEAIRSQFVAVSWAVERAVKFGVRPDRVFEFGDWVGGRYSVWGPVGLSVMLAIGPDRFREFLDGGRFMDRHFLEKPPESNLPVLLAATGLWHNQVLGYATRAVLPYDQRLRLLPSYLQQLEMESNGKQVGINGSPLTEHSSPVIWGDCGTNGQHAFFQQLHQGTRIVPCEFLVAANGHEPELKAHHEQLLSNCLAQSEALMEGMSVGKAKEIVRRELPDADSEQVKMLARHRCFSGNRPSITLIYPKLTPFVLGKIIALYEHRVFVEGVAVGLNSFDQWGVELGKSLAKSILEAINGKSGTALSNPSTRALLDYASRHRDGRILEDTGGV